MSFIAQAICDLLADFLRAFFCGGAAAPDGDARVRRAVHDDFKLLARDRDDDNADGLGRCGSHDGNGWFNGRATQGTRTV